MKKVRRVSTTGQSMIRDVPQGTYFSRSGQLAFRFSATIIALMDSASCVREFLPMSQLDATEVVEVLSIDAPSSLACAMSPSGTGWAALRRLGSWSWPDWRRYWPSRPVLQGAR